MPLKAWHKLHEHAEAARLCFRLVSLDRDIVRGRFYEDRDRHERVGGGKGKAMQKESLEPPARHADALRTRGIASEDLQALVARLEVRKLYRDFIAPLELALGVRQKVGSPEGGQDQSY